VNSDPLLAIRHSAAGTPPLDALISFGKLQVATCANAKMAKSRWEQRMEPLA
jgi:hypothetical protein